MPIANGSGRSSQSVWARKLWLVGKRFIRKRVSYVEFMQMAGAYAAESRSVVALILFSLRRRLVIRVSRMGRPVAGIDRGLSGAASRARAATNGRAVRQISVAA